MPDVPKAVPSTDGTANAESAAADALPSWPDRPLSELTQDELMALKAEFEARGIAIYNSCSPEQLLFAGLAITYSKAFMETLGKNHAEWLSEFVRARFRKKGRDRELLVIQTTTRRQILSSQATRRTKLGSPCSIWT
jgi:hypothetical protein